MRPRFCLLMVLSLLLLTQSANLALADDPGERDTCRVGCQGVTSPDEQVVVSVTVYNDEDLGGLAVPLVFGRPGLDVVCDSVSFVGTRVDYADYLGASVDTTNYKLVFYAVFIDSDLIAGDGAVANLHFTTGLGWDSTVCFQIDTTFFPPTTVLEFTPRATGQALHPEFQIGCLGSGITPVPQLVSPADEVNLCSPLTFDFVWSDGGEALFYTLEFAADSEFVNGVVTIDNLEDTTYSVTLARGTYYWHVKSNNLCGEESFYQDSPFSFTIYHSGDATNDGTIDLSDAIWILNYLYKSGPEPDPLESGDATCDGLVDLADAVRLLNYLFKAGPPPCCP